MKKQRINPKDMKKITDQFLKESGIRLKHGVFKYYDFYIPDDCHHYGKRAYYKSSGYVMNIPAKFDKLLRIKYDKWSLRLDKDITEIEFVIAKGKNYSAISIYSPDDLANPKFGTHVAIERLLHARAGRYTKIKKIKNEGKPNEEFIYRTLPRTVERLPTLTTIYDRVLIDKVESSDEIKE